ncbi:hypothetical protein [Hafnia paralvei]|uniref:hypothetical protein n=2 Tax=Hafnia paralvei TaxID=546367 RepID=UPI001F1ED414|nr:hypothetical protein [Hafnia paralvei]MCE9949258.1 hypothetical protein [Hafnia paralvei]
MQESPELLTQGLKLTPTFQPVRWGLQSMRRAYPLCDCFSGVAPVIQKSIVVAGVDCASVMALKLTYWIEVAIASPRLPFRVLSSVSTAYRPTHSPQLS